MERLTKREGKHTIRIGNEWRRHDAGWDKLAEYEDLEEERLLMEFPITIGSIVFRVNKACDNPISMDVIEIKIKGFTNTFKEFLCKEHVYGCLNTYKFNDIGRTVFLIKEEAEQKLKELKGEQQNDRKSKMVQQ
jgi:hypothetical protein